MQTTPEQGSMSSSAASEQVRHEQEENQTTAPEIPAAADGHDEESPHEDPPVGTPEQEIHGDSEDAPPESPGDVDQKGEGEESSQNDTLPTTNEDAGLGDDGASQDPLGLTEAEVKEFESELEKISGMDLNEVTDALKKSHRETVQANHGILKLTTLTLKQGLLNGHILNRAKELNPKKGEFSKWRKKEVVDSGLMSERTAQRYMEMARKCPSVADLPKAATSIRQVYQQLGILPSDQKAAGEGNEQSSGKRSDLESLMKGLLDTQNTLRNLVQKVCGEGKPKLQPEQLDQLRLNRTEIDGFFAKLLGETESGKEQGVGKLEEGSGDNLPLDPPDPGADAKSKGDSTTHLAMGQAEPDSKKPAAGKRKSGKSQTPATASK